MMSNIRLSKKYGVNPTIPICFWCGKERGDIALMGHIGDGRKHEDIQAPQYMVLDYTPCDNCKKRMSQGFTIIEATAYPNAVTNVEIQTGIFPTSRFVIIKSEAVTKLFKGISPETDKAFLDSAIYNKMFCNMEVNE